MRLLQKARDILQRVWHSSHKNPNKNTTKPTNTSFLSKNKLSKNITKIASKIATFFTNIATKIWHFLRYFFTRQILHKYIQIKLYTSRFFANIFAPFFFHIVTPFLDKILTRFLANVSKWLICLKHSAYKIPFIKNTSQAISAFATTYYHRYKRKIYVKSARLIQHLKNRKMPLRYIALYALCEILAFFSVFLLGVRYGVESLLDSALPNAKQSHLLRSFIDSALDKSNLTLIPKEYLASLQKQQDFNAQENSPQDNAPKDTQQESTPKSPPQMPKIDESKYVFYGNYSFSHALNLAKSAILERDFVRARIWIYKAWDLQEYSQAVWEAYLQSYEEDAGASDEVKQEAKRIFQSAKEYYGF